MRVNTPLQLLLYLDRKAGPRIRFQPLPWDRPTRQSADAIGTVLDSFQSCLHLVQRILLERYQAQYKITVKGVCRSVCNVHAVARSFFAGVCCKLVHPFRKFITQLQQLLTLLLPAVRRRCSKFKCHLPSTGGFSLSILRRISSQPFHNWLLSRFYSMLIRLSL